MGGPAISSDYERRVNASTQKSGNRHVGHALPLDGPEQSLRNRLGGIGEVSADARIGPDLVKLHYLLPLRCDQMSRPLGQGANFGKAGERFRDVTQAHEVVASLAVDARAEAGER